MPTPEPDTTDYDDKTPAEKRLNVVVWTLLVISFLYGCAVMTNYMLVDYRLLEAIWPGCVAVCIAIPALFVTKIYKHWPGMRVFTAVVVASFMFFYSTIALVNGALDESPPRTVTSVVSKKVFYKDRKTSHWRIYFPHWDRSDEQLKWISPPHVDSIEPGTRIAVQIKPGYLGYEHYVRDTFEIE